MRIGLFGGSFDPAHEGHAHVAETALKRLGLDRVWWLVTPQNPLKPQSSPFEKRLKSARAMAHGSKMVVTDLEKQLGSRFTFETLRALISHYPDVDFYLVMGGRQPRQLPQMAKLARGGEQRPRGHRIAPRRGSPRTAKRTK